MDLTAIDGMTVNQLADYATMRGLAQTKPLSGEPSFGTILNLFDPDAVHRPSFRISTSPISTSLYSNSRT